MACTLEDYVNSKTAECYIIFSKWLNRKKMEWPWSDFITEAVGVIALLAWWHYSPTNSCSPAELHPHLSRPQSTWNFSIMFWEPKKTLFYQTDEPRNVTDPMSERGLKGEETERGEVINNSGAVCYKAGEGGLALRKADPPSSQAYSCHSTPTYTHRAKEQVGFKRNKLPKYGSEKALEKSSIGNRWKWS